MGCLDMESPLRCHPMSQFSDLKLLTKADAAAVFGVCTKTIDNYIRDGLLPSPIPFGSREYWHPGVFRDFLDRTFGMVKASPDCALSPPSADSFIPPSTERPRVRRSGQNRGTKKDSSPFVRQQGRQDALLRTLNAGG